jgi:hypothetical protein
VGELVAQGVVKRLLQLVVPFILSLLTSLGLFGCSELCNELYIGGQICTAALFLFYVTKVQRALKDPPSLLVPACHTFSLGI